MSTTHGRAVPRSLFACLLIIFSCAVAAAQEKVNYCEPSPAVKLELKKISDVSSDELLYPQRRKRQAAMLEELVKKFPGDFHLLKRQFDNRREADDRDWDALLAEYRASMNKSGDDPASVYFYAKLLVGHNTKEAIDQLNKLTQRSPEFPWSYLELADIYYFPVFRDPAKLHDNLKKWMSLCSPQEEELRLLARGDDLELIGESTKRLRARLEAAPVEEDLRGWETLWTLEFKLKPVAEYSQVRRQIAEDLKRLRAGNLNTKQWFSLLQTGYKLADDREGRKWAEDELLRLFPQSSWARSINRTRWRDEHPAPKEGDPPEKRRAYYQTLLKATEEEAKLWPDDWSLLKSRFTAVSELDISTADEIEEAGLKYLEAMKKDAGAVIFFPPADVQVAQVFARHNIATARIPSLVLAGLEETERYDKRNWPTDLYPRERTGDGNLKSVQWQGWPLLAEAYAKLGQAEKAREVLKEMAEALKQGQPAENAAASNRTIYATRQVTYWRTNAKVAEAEKRKLDALVSYQTALSFRPKLATPGPGKNDGLADDAGRLWKELGGTDEGLQAYLARNEGAKDTVESTEVATWDARVQQLPDFALLDLQGKKWQLADLKGKVTFINLWATWCGPCVAELPYVQKLHEQMKENRDVLVLTLNLDRELGVIEPFMKEKKYSFTVIPAESYADGMGVNSIPRNWVVSDGGTIRFEGLGFGGEGDEWMKKATETIRKVQGLK